MEKILKAGSRAVRGSMAEPGDRVTHTLRLRGVPADPLLLIAFVIPTPSVASCIWKGELSVSD